MFLFNNRKRKINGIRIGESGASGSLYSGFKLDYGDNFTRLPTVWSGNNLSGEYSSNPPSSGARRIAYDASHMIYIDPHWRGAASQSPVGLGYSPYSLENGYLKITASPVPSEATSYLPTNYTQGGGDQNFRPYLFSGRLCTTYSYMFSSEANWILEAVVRVPSGAAASWWGSFWCTGMKWPWFGEVDIFEGQRSGASGLVSLKAIHSSATDGGADDPRVTTLNYGVDVDIHVVAKKIGNQIQFWDDFGSQGTLVNKYTIGETVDRLKGPHDVRMELAVSSSWQNGFNLNQWPNSISYKWFRCWTPVGSYDNKKTKNIAAFNVVAGESINYSIPDNSVLFGNDYTPNIIDVCGIFDNDDSPGFATRVNRLPGGLTVDMNSRTVTGAFPTTFGGRTGLFFTASSASGGAARRAAVFFNVAPVNKSLFSNQTVAQGGAVNLSIAYTAFHSGNLGAHTYTVNKTGGSWLTITGNGTTSIGITGTAPNSVQVVTLEIICTNGIGQATTVTRTITVS